MPELKEAQIIRAVFIMERRKYKAAAGLQITFPLGSIAFVSTWWKKEKKRKAKLPIFTFIYLHEFTRTRSSIVFIFLSLSLSLLK